MLIKAMQRTDKQSGQIQFLVDKKVSDTAGLWSADVRFAQICDSEVYNAWEFENDDRRGKVFNFTYELVEIEAEVYYHISDPRGWIVIEQKPGAHSLEIYISHSKKLASIIAGSKYEEIRSHFDIMGFEQHKKTRVFPYN